MIRNETEYREARRRVRAGRDQLVAYQAMLEEEERLTPEEVAHGVALLAGFHQQLEDEVASYERLKRGDLGPYQDIRDIGALLIAARIARGLSRRDLAKKLGVHESQVSRDERNEYHGISYQRACEIFDAIGVDVRLRAEIRSDAAPRATGSESRVAGEVSVG